MYPTPTVALLMRCILSGLHNPNYMHADMQTGLLSSLHIFRQLAKQTSLFGRPADTTKLPSAACVHTSYMPAGYWTRRGQTSFVLSSAQTPTKRYQMARIFKMCTKCFFVWQQNEALGTSHGLALEPLGEERSQGGALGNLGQQARAERVYARPREILFFDLKQGRSTKNKGAETQRDTAGKKRKKREQHKTAIERGQGDRTTTTPSVERS